MLPEHAVVDAQRLVRRVCAECKDEYHPEKEEFVGDTEAGKWLARQQRKPWTYDMV